MVKIRIKKKKLFFLIKLVYFYEKGIGLCPFAFDENGFFIFSSFGIIYSIILCILYCIAFVRAMVNRSVTRFPMETVIAAIVATFIDSMQFIIVIVAWLIFALRQKRVLFIFHNFERTEKIARKVGIKDERWPNTLCIRIIFVNIIFGGLYFSKIVVAFFSPALNWTIWLPYELPHIVIYNCLTLFITALEVLETRFHKLNINLRNLMMHSTGRSRDKEIMHKFSNSVPMILGYFSELHDELMVLSEMITNYFAPVTLMTLLLSFLQIVKNSYFLCLFITDRKFYETGDLMSTMYGSFWVSLLLLKFIFIAFSSGNIRDEANNSGDALFKLWAYHKPANCQKSIIKISHQLLQRKLDISLYGFINLDYNFLYRICGAITTYLIIMLQMDGTNK